MAHLTLEHAARVRNFKASGRAKCSWRRRSPLPTTKNSPNRIRVWAGVRWNLELNRLIPHAVDSVLEDEGGGKSLGAVSNQPVVKRDDDLGIKQLLAATEFSPTKWSRLWVSWNQNDRRNGVEGPENRRFAHLAESVIGIEIDRDMAEAAKATCADLVNVRIIEAILRRCSIHNRLWHDVARSSGPILSRCPLASIR